MNKGTQALNETKKFLETMTYAQFLEICAEVESLSDMQDTQPPFSSEVIRVTLRDSLDQITRIITAKTWLGHERTLVKSTSENQDEIEWETARMEIDSIRKVAA